MSKKNIIAIVGNPNCGKTTLFNELTGAKQFVGNWPGVTVEKKEGKFSIGSEEITLVDLPGVYSLLPSSGISEDEKIAREYLMSNEAAMAINIIDASNLERNLYLTTQLLEMGVPLVVAVNMTDVAKKHGIRIDMDKLKNALGCPVVEIIASKGKGVKELKEAVLQQLKEKKTAPNPIEFTGEIKKALVSISSEFDLQHVQKPAWVAEQILEGDGTIRTLLPNVDFTHIDRCAENLKQKFGEDLDIEIADTRYRFVSEVASKVILKQGMASDSLTAKLDRVILNRWLGIPIFLLVMYLMFIFSIKVGSAFIDFFDIFVGGVCVDWFGEFLTGLGTPDWLKTILANGIGGGIQTVSTFIPVIACLFLSLSFLEDSGYMARAAFVMDRFMRAIGLPGKSFVPLIIGFGCGVPAIMASRTMEKKSDRITTALMAPFMSCGARLPVYVLFATAFWPMNGQNLVFSLYVIGIAVAILTGFMLRRTALAGETSAFVMEIPPYHLPTISNLVYSTWDRLKSFIIRAGKVIVALVAVISFLNSIGTDGSFGNENTDKSVLSNIGKTIVPAFKPMGIQEENWPAAVGVFTGVLAKEAVVGTLDALYGGMGDPQEPEKVAEEAGATPEEEEGFSLVGTFKEAVQSIGDNFSETMTFFTDPMGISVDDDLSNTEEQAEAQSVSSATITSMNRLFDGQLGAFAYLLMVLLYLPCGAAMGAIYREVGTNWFCFAGLWTTLVGYCSATVVYQIGTFASHPAYSAICLACCAASVGAVVYGLYRVGKGSDDNPRLIPSEQPV